MTVFLHGQERCLEVTLVHEALLVGVQGPHINQIIG